jgi:hypothetical protein
VNEEECGRKQSQNTIRYPRTFLKTVEKTSVNTRRDSNMITPAYEKFIEYY